MRALTSVGAVACCLLVCFLAGCSYVGALYVRTWDGLYGSDGPSVNGFRLSRSGDGFGLVAGGRVRGPHGEEVTGWSVLDSLDLASSTTVEIRSSTANAEIVGDFLRFSQAGCGSPREMLRAGISKVGALFGSWIAGSELPHVQLTLFPSGEGYVFFDRMNASTIQGLTFPLAQSLPESRTCSWLKQWSTDTIEIIVHEMLHIHVFQRFGPDADWLANEVAAYSSGLCVQLELQDKLPARRVLAPTGLDSDSLQDVIHWRDSARISTTMAGNFLADRLRRRELGDRELGEQDKPALQAWCGGLISQLVDISKLGN